MANFEEMMGNFMEMYMAKYMEAAMQKMMGDLMGEPTVAKAEVTTPVQPTAVRVTAEELENEYSNEVADSSNAELGAWKSVDKNGKSYVWYGWADANTGKPVFPGKRLYHINDFYLKRDYDAYHPGKTTRYKFKNGGASAFIKCYKTRNEVAKEDAQAFIKFMQDKESARAERVHDTPDFYTNWCNNNK